MRGCEARNALGRPTRGVAAMIHEKMIIRMVAVYGICLRLTQIAVRSPKTGSTGHVQCGPIASRLASGSGQVTRCISSSSCTHGHTLGWTLGYATDTTRSLENWMSRINNTEIIDLNYFFLKYRPKSIGTDLFGWANVAFRNATFEQIMPVILAISIRRKTPFANDLAILSG